MSWSPPWVMPHRHPVGCTDVEPIETCQSGHREDPRFAAVEYHGLNHRFVEFCRDKRGDIFRPEHLPDTSPSGSGFPQLGADCLDVIVVLRKQVSQVFEYLHSLQHIPIDRKLLPEGQCQRYRRLSLFLPLDPNLTLLCEPVTGVPWVNLLHSTLSTPVELPLFWDLD